jgi:uncharacterized membrane protein
MEGQQSMATLTAIKFDTPDGAEQAYNLLKDLERQQLIQVHDAAIVSWPSGAKKPKTKQMTGMAGIGALDGAFWGLLFGLIFFVPLFGMAIGALTGAIAGSMTDVGIDDNFIKATREKVTAGTSALFLLSSGAVTDRVLEAMKSLPKHELIASNLSQEQEDQLRAAFA